MKIITTILAVLISVSSIYSQKENSRIEKFLQKVIQNASKGNVWVMDVMKSYTGQGSIEWDFDYTEIVLERNSKGLPTLIETQEKLEGTQTWVNVYHAEISYFDNDTIHEYKLKEWNTNTNSWNTDLSYYEIMNEDGKLLIHFFRAWSNDYGYFTQGNRETYTYNAEGYKIQKLDDDWYNDTWEDYFKTTYTYDENNNLILDFQQRFISTNNWRDNWKTEYEYNANNQKIREQEYGYDWDYAVWFDYSKTIFTYYESNGLIKDEFTERFDYEGTEEWYDASKNNYFYTTNDLLDYKEELDLEVSDNNLKYVYTYNENNQETSFFLYDWNGSEWILFYKVFDSYDENGNQTEYYSQVSDGTWQNYIKEEYTWNEFASINDLNNLQVNVYPNPATSILNIVTEEKLNIEILNMTGQIIYNSFETCRETKLNVSNYPAGTYFVKLYNLNGEKIIKFFKN